MLRNYLAAALRNLVRNRLYAAINIAGLALGFAAALLIALFVRDEFSYDSWIPGHEDAYIMGATIHMPGTKPVSAHISDMKDAATLRLDFPEIASVARIVSQDNGLRRGDIEAREQIAWADAEIFHVLPLPVLHGELNSALNEPDSIVLTRRIAEKYFGHTDVVGESIELDRTHTMRVTAVLEDLPSRTHINIDVWAALRPPSLAPGATGGKNPLTYLRLKPGTSAAAVQSRLPDWVDRHSPLPPDMQKVLSVKTMSALKSMWLQPLSEIHERPPENLPFGLLSRLNSPQKPVADPQLLAALVGVGALILFVATANFVNLMTARAGRRAVEVGVRKVTGANRRNLIVQFLGESFVYVLTALVLAIAVVAVGMPAFNAFLERQIAIELWRDISMPAIIVGLVVVATALGGIYPAFILSGYRPATVLKSGLPAAAGSSLLRQALVIAQFAIFVGLILATTVMARQTVFALRSGFQAAGAQILVAIVPCRDSVTNQLRAVEGVHGVACTGGTLVGGSGDGELQMGMDQNGNVDEIVVVRVDAGLLELFGLRPIAGRFFDPSDTAIDQVVLNESAVRQLGYESLDKAIGRRGRYAESEGPEIIGVVDDFPLGSLQGPIPATQFKKWKEYDHVALKLDGSHLGETLARIEQVFRSLDVSPPRTYFYDQYVQRLYRGLVKQGQAFTAFAAVAIVIAALGLFGLSAFTAEQRTKEIGIRKAMGATRADILRLLLWQFTKPVLWANVIAWPVAYFVMQRWLEGFVYHIDLAPWMFLAASALALVIAVLTVLGHALLVARTQPASALRYE